MWNSFRTDEPLGLTAEITTYTAGGGDAVRAYVAKPTVGGPAPGVVLLHHRPGWDEFYQESAERLARHGYQVLAPDLYSRFGNGTAEEVAAKARAEGGVSDDSVVADCAAALEWLKSQPESNGHVGIMGGCSGGRHSVLVASRVRGFDAVVDLWGGNVVVKPEQLSAASPVAVIDLTSELSAPVLGLFGNDDQSPSPEQVDIHEAALKAHGKEYEFHRYDGAGHSFFCYDTPRYRQEQAIDGWNRVFSFFGDKLRP